MKDAGIACIMMGWRLVLWGMGRDIEYRRFRRMSVDVCEGLTKKMGFSLMTFWGM